MMSAEGTIDISVPSAASTRAVAAQVARLSRGGDLILLVGDLGAGKTVFAQGFAAEIGVTDRVTSPTFALVQSYEGDRVMHHLDVYRLVHSSEVADLGLSELLDDDAVTLIEWGDMIVSSLPNDFLEIQILVCVDGPIAPETHTKIGESGESGSEPAEPGAPSAGPEPAEPGASSEGTEPGDGAGEPAERSDEPVASSEGPDIVEVPTTRRVVLTARGPSWRSRIGALRSAILSAEECEGVEEC